MSQFCWTGNEPGVPPWDFGVRRVIVREFESWYRHYFPRYCNQKAQSRGLWTAGVYWSGLKGAERETGRSFEMRGYCCRLHFFEGLLICEQRWTGFSICRKINNLICFRCSLLSDHLSFSDVSKYVNAHAHTHSHLTCDPSADGSADTVRTVVAGPFIPLF
jgi:hypothetical protein